MSYSLDFRKQIFSIKEKYKLTFEEASIRFDIPIRTLFRWKKRLEPCSKRNKPATKIDMEALTKDVELYPDHYHSERAKKFNVSTSGICVALKRLGVRCKKNSRSFQSERRSTYQLPS